MKQQALYILAFKDEPLVKVGLAVDARIRSLALGYGRFDFAGSYVVRSKDQACIRTLERNLKTFFASHRVKPQSPMRNGNSETFDSSSLPRILQSIEAFKNSFPDAGFHIDRDLSSLVHPPRPRAKNPDLPQVSPSPEMQQTLNDLSKWCGEEFGRQRILAKEIGVSEQVVSHWLNRSRTPRLKHWLKLQEFLKKHRKRK